MPYLILFSSRNISLQFDSPEKADFALFSEGWQLVTTRPDRLYSDPETGGLACLIEIPRKLEYNKPLEDAYKDFDTRPMWGMIWWLMVNRPELNLYPEPEDPEQIAFQMKAIYRALGDQITVHLPPPRLLVRTMRSRGEIKAVSMRLNRYTTTSVLIPDQSPGTPPLNPDKFNFPISVLPVGEYHRRDT